MSGHEEEKGWSSQRFEIERSLGSGAFGLVYAARDPDRGRSVALKVLQNATPDSLYRFKQEFRSLSGIRHRNLATLYELVEENGEWILVMELVHGSELLEFLTRAESSRVLQRDLPTMRLDQDWENVEGSGVVPLLTPTYLKNLRIAMKQLAEGVYALHSAGKLHRDIKPSNILVTAEGRVVLLDFGLVFDLEGDRFDESKTLVGTPGYIAPEIVRGEKFTEAADWYALGVILFQALTGRLPFEGTFFEVMALQQKGRAEFHPSELATLPEDLTALTLELLARDPAARPAGAEIISRLGGNELTVWLPPFRSETIGHGQNFVGRRRELEQLRGWFSGAAAGESQLVYLEGMSGTGKTALLNQLFDSVRQQRDVFIFAARCHENESVPFKAVDGVIDSLARALRRYRGQGGELESLLPDGFDALVQLFPIFAKVLPKYEPATPPRSEDVKQRQQRAFVAFRELIGNLAGLHPILIAIDDAQWGDFDSAALLGELLASLPPKVMVVLCSTSEDRKTSLFLQLLGGREFAGQQHLSVEPLLPLDAALLVQQLIPRLEIARIPDLVAESGGMPFWIEMLARHLDSSDPTRITFRSAFNRLLASVPQEARELLALIAIAGQPIETRALFEGLSAPDADRGELLEILRKHRLIRTRLTGAIEEAEVYHRQIREIVLDGMDDDMRRSSHVRLAASLESAGMAGSATLASHFAAGGERERAFHHAVSAGDDYVRALAFERAVRMYRFAGELSPRHVTSELSIKTGESLLRIGRELDAAEAFAQAAHQAPWFRRGGLAVRAARHFAVQGRPGAALAVFGSLLVPRRRGR